MQDEDKTREQLITELHELRQRLAESEKDKAKHKRVEEALRESERRLTEVQRIGKIGDWEWIPAENKVIWSAEMYAIFGIAPETVSLTTEMCIQAFHPEDRAMVSEATLKTLQEHKPQLIECRILKPDGTISYVHGRGEALLDANGKLVKMIGIYQDITERNLAEEALRQSEELLRVTLTNILDPVFITDNDGKFTFICPNVPHILGYSVEELQAMGTISKLLGDGFFSREELEMRGEITNIERLIVDNYGRQRVFLTTVKRVSILEGTHLYAMHDITERTKAEIALHESEVRFRELFNHISSGVAVYEAIDNGGDFIFRDFNPAAEKIEKVSRKDILGKRVSEAFPGVKAFGVFEVFQRVWQTGKSEYFPDNIYKDERDPGSWRESWVLKLPTDEIVVVYNDLTERKRAEEALRESEERHRQISDLIADYAYSCIKPAGGEFVIDWLAGAVEEITGYSAEEVQNHGCLKFLVYPADITVFEKNVIGLGLGDGSECELRIVHKDGSIRWIRASSRVIEDSKNPLSHRLFGSCVGITERKVAEVLSQSRMLMLDFAATHSLEELLRYTLDEVGRITDSPIGFYHFVESDQKTLSLQAWSTRTVKEFCTAQGKGFHYPIDDAGVWVDCVRQGQPVIHNDYLSLPHRKGLPEGHAPVMRELAVPIFRNNLVVAILGVGNKPWDYTWDDVEIVTYLADIAWEITKRKRSEEALRESEAQLDLALRSAQMGVWYWDIVEDRRHFDDQVCHLLGIDRAAFTGSEEDFFGVVHPDDREKLRATLALTIEQNDLYEPEYRTVWPDGSAHCITARGRVVRDEEGRPLRINGILWDITERKQAEEERRTLQERLHRAEKMEALGTLAGGVAHDLNNILGVVVGYSGMLRDDLDESGSTKSEAMEIFKAARRAAVIVQDLLTLTRRGVTSRKVLNLNNIIIECQDFPEFANLLSYHPNIRVKSELEADLLNVSGSSVHLGKSFLNLVSNAAEAMPNGGSITIKTGNQYLDKPVSGYDEIREGDYVVLSISDTGEGLPIADLKRIFEPFYTKKVMGRSGTGLGLAVVWGTVKDHHGYINLESEEGKGTTFTLYFPVTREELTPEDVAVCASEYMGKGEPILIVDDVKEQRELSGTMLKKLNYNVVSVSSGEEAVEYIKNHAVDLIVLDMIMTPGLDGLDTYVKILEIHPYQKAIIVSGFSETERVTKALELGAGAYVKKPYVLQKLGLAVRKELDRST
jgi:PAS domain S-box-containing protein